MTKFVIQKSPTETRFMRLHHIDGIVWEIDKELANHYSSKYAARRHARNLIDLPQDALVIEFAR